MAPVDIIPVVSQAKSLIQVVGGDVAGAKATQQIFSKRCIIVSQARSAFEAATGRRKDAAETQREFMRRGGSGVVQMFLLGGVVAGFFAGRRRNRGAGV
ncbi:hypothetical protein FOA52_011961 [Chlamydomonas sp. UWO 241]|nr:hypothetical protein FOA52_007278 [Chlamydomonas sp. UWO 241]KAG1658495.1 hypothetical protein FOA52_011961 [Chlamydomonas sp. UWO 241]